MNYNVIQSNDFNDDFDYIFSYIAESLKAPKAADDLRKNIIKSAKNLQTMPKAYPKLDDIIFNNKPVRFFNAKKFKILFTIEKETVIMHSIIYSKSEKYKLKYKKDNS